MGMLHCLYNYSKDLPIPIQSRTSIHIDDGIPATEITKRRQRPGLKGHAILLVVLVAAAVDAVGQEWKTVLTVFGIGRSRSEFAVADAVALAEAGRCGGAGGGRAFEGLEKITQLITKNVENAL